MDNQVCPHENRYGGNHKYSEFGSGEAAHNSLRQQAEPPPTRGVSRESATACANGGLRRLDSPLVTLWCYHLKS
jgi:hypothetical protein